MLNANLYVTVVGSVIALLVIFLLIYRSFYKKAPADSALVISGGRKKRVIFGGSLINPLTNTTQLISLNTLQLPVERTGQAALITEVTNELMKPAERIESIRVLDLGGGNGNGSSSMNRILSSIVNAGAAVPLLKEIVGFSGLDTEKIAQTVRDYASGVVVDSQVNSSESTDDD